jgi:2-polyprenyl-3-methyl-5-hydroxy-6-metoxy-1,4-benzoquinol methylase
MDPIDAGLSELCSQVVDDDYLASRDDRTYTFRDHLRSLEKYLSKGKLLDVGCYAGVFLKEAKLLGFDVTGVEPSSWAASYAKSSVGCQVYEGMFDTTEIPDGPFDVITIWDVIEHLANPKECLQKCFKLLKTDGVIAITTHDIESVFARMLGARYPWLMRFHLVHFSPATLGALLEDIGFEILETTKYKKPLSIQYFLKRFGISVASNAITKKRIAFDTKDMFIIIAKKK